MYMILMTLNSGIFFIVFLLLPEPQKVQITRDNKIRVSPETEDEEANNNETV